MTAANRYDQASRYLAYHHPLEFLCWLLNLPVSAFSYHGWLDTRNIPFPGDPERIRDTVAFLRDLLRGGVPWAILLEFQASADPLMFGRLLQYLGGLWVEKKAGPNPGDRFFVGAVVLNLTGKGSCPPAMEWPEAGLLTHLGVIERDLASLDGPPLFQRVEKGEVGRPVLPLFPLMQNMADPVIIRRWLDVAAAEPDRRWRADFGALARVFAELSERPDLWHTALEGWQVTESPSVVEWQVESHRVTLVELLQTRFGPLAEDLEKRLRSARDLGIVRRWVLLAAQVKSLDEFRQQAGLE